MRVALGQYQARRGDVGANLQRMDEVITTSGAELVVFPELFLTGYMARDEHMRLAETLEGDSVQQVAAAAASNHPTAPMRSAVSMSAIPTGPSSAPASSPVPPTAAASKSSNASTAGAGSQPAPSPPRTGCAAGSCSATLPP